MEQPQGLSSPLHIGHERSHDVFDDGIQRKTFRFVVSLCAQKLFPARHFKGGHALGQGYWFGFDHGVSMAPSETSSLLEAITTTIKNDLPITKTQRDWKTVYEYMKAKKQLYAASLMKTRVTPFPVVHECDGELRLGFTDLLPSTGELECGLLNVISMPFGCLVTYGNFKMEPAIIESMREHRIWGWIHAVQCIGHLNSLSDLDRGRQSFIISAEMRQEAKLSDIATRIKARRETGNPVRLIALAGPTSSGKTTFAHKLSIYLKNVGVSAKPFSADCYYLPLDEQPGYKKNQRRDEVDYDAFEAVDVALLNEHLSALLRGESITMPSYDFASGYRGAKGKTFRLDVASSEIIVLEGIHALNPLFTQAVDDDNKFKIYISPLSAIQVDDFNSVRTTDHRLLRRICRDYQFRGASASVTLQMWPNVRKGEHHNIFVNQNNADYVMNSAMEYEICVLKVYVEPLLRAVRPDDPQFEKCQQLAGLMDHFAAWPDHHVPATSVLREFIGGSAFNVH